MAAGGVLVVLQQVHDVAGLLHVVDAVNHIFAVFLIELLNHVHSVVGVHLLELAGQVLVRHEFQQVGTLVLVEFHQHIGRRFLIEQLHDKQRLIGIEVTHQLGDVGRVHVLDLFQNLRLVLVVDELVDLLQIVFSILFHGAAGLWP